MDNVPMSLEVRHLEKTFRDKLTLKQRQVLFDVNFSVPEKSITGFLGSNGAGKTTTMKCLLGLLRAERGDVRFFKGELADPRSSIGYLPERPYFYDYLTGLEFLMFYGDLSLRLSRADLRTRAELLLEKVGLGAAKDKLLRSFSKGMLQRIGLAQAIIHEPRFLILDEPMSGLDPDGRYQVTELIKELGEQGTTIFFSSHLLDDVEKLCSRLVIIDHGRILFEGAKNDFLKTGEGEFEVSYQASGDSRVQKITLSNMSAVVNFLGDLQKSSSRLVQVREPRVTLEEAFNRLKRESSAP